MNEQEFNEEYQSAEGLRDSFGYSAGTYHMLSLVVRLLFAILNELRSKRA